MRLRHLWGFIARRRAAKLEHLRAERARLVAEVFDRKPGHQVAQHQARALLHAELALSLGRSPSAWRGR